MTLSSSQRETLERATRNYAVFGPLAHSYLEGRGLEPALADTYRLGVVVEPEIGHEAYVDRLSIPYITKSGVVYMKFRCMEDHECKDLGHPKYMNMSSKTRIFNTRAFFTDEPFIAIAEGEIDAMVLHSAAGIPAVSIPGVQNWKPHYERCFSDFDQVFLFADGDDPGKDFAKQVSQVLDGLTVIQMPAGLDVNTVYQTEGAEGLRRRAGL